MVTGDRTNSVRCYWWFENKHTVQEYCMLVVNFGDSPASFILDEGEHIVCKDKDISPETRTFIQQGFYVDDGTTSSMTTTSLELIASKPGPVLQRYAFNIKHVLKSYQKSKGVTTSSTTEGFLGLLWDFFRDELLPILDVYLCAKYRGLKMEKALSLDTIKDCIITARTVLRIMGCLYDLSLLGILS